MQSKQDPLARLRSLDPALTFHEGDDSAEASAVFRQTVGTDPSSPKRQRRTLSVHRLAAVAAVLVFAWLVLPAFAIGPKVVHLLVNKPAPNATPVNGLIAASGVDAIYLVNPKSGAVLKVRNTRAMDKPAWSPNGRLLAVELTQKGTTSVYTIRPNGTHPQLILKNASSPAWSTDGSRIFVQRDTCGVACKSSDDDTTVIFSVSPDGSDAHQIGDEDVYDVSEAGWPPDANVLAFLQDGGSGPSTLDSSAAAWSPDGNVLAFADAPTGIWLVNDGGKPRRLVKGKFGSLSWGTAVKAPAARPAAR